MLERLGFDLPELVAIATNGTPCTISMYQGVVVQLQILVPHLIRIHCIANWEALAVKEANDGFPLLDSLVKLSIRCISVWNNR